MICPTIQPNIFRPTSTTQEGDWIGEEESRGMVQTLTHVDKCSYLRVFYYFLDLYQKKNVFPIYMAGYSVLDQHPRISFEHMLISHLYLIHKQLV